MVQMTQERVTQVEHAREVDTEVARLWEIYWDNMKPGDKAMAEAKEFRAQDNKRIKYDRVDRFNPEPYTESKDHAWRLSRIAEWEAKAKEFYAAAAPLAETAHAFDAANYEGWQRFFLVEHIHRSQHCSSFRPTTRIGWLPEVSGLTEKEAVEVYGPKLCTICFPSAPVEWTNGQLKADEVCEGSGKYIAPEMKRGMGGTCPDCGQWVNRASSYNMSFRKHKAVSA